MRDKLDPRAPLVLDTRELGRRPGSQRTTSFSAEAPAELGIEVLGVPEGSPVANYGFDVTPARLVTGLITERGVISADRAALAKAFPERAG